MIGQDQEDRLEHRVVARLERLLGERPEAGPAEHDLDRDRAGDDEAEVDADERDRRQQGVRDRVAAQDARLAEALGLGRRDVVLAAGLDDRRAHQDRVLADQPEADRGQRQDEVAPEVEELVARTTCRSCPSVEHAGRREPAERGREDDQQDHAQQEVRHRIEDERDAVAGVVDDAAASPAAVRAEDEPDDDRDQLAQTEQDDRRPDAAGDDLGDVLALELERLPEVALDGRLESTRRTGPGRAACRGPSAPGGRPGPRSTAFGLRESRSGDPGIIRNRTKLSRTIAAIVRIACRIRRRR